MLGPTIGDMTRPQMLTRLGTALRQDIQTRTQELSTGRVADRTQALRGDIGRVTRLESARAAATAGLEIARGAALRLEATQHALARIAEPAAETRNTLLRSVQTGTAGALAAAQLDAEGTFRQVVATLDTALAGRSLFAGVASDGPALAAADTMLDALRAGIAGAPTAEAAAAAISAWFAPGGGFDDSGYLGGPAADVPLRLPGNMALPPGPTAAAPAFRETLAALATAALSGDGPGASDLRIRSDMAATAAARLGAAGDALIGLAETLGRDEARAAAAETVARSEGHALDTAIAGLLEADPFETAARLEDAMTRLEALYTVAARSARLNLTGFLR
ncbi:MAG: hypothetical protein JJU42_08695 [Rhodobacteraceae bacterium]|nr:hypothetical protein [Paracoccaceae bacterium]